MINKYPYTNFHELNLDWIVEEMLKVSKDVETINKWKDEWTDEFEDIRTLIDDLNTKYTSLEADFNNLVTTVNTNFTILTNEFTNKFNAQEDKINLLFEKQKKEVSDRLDTFQTEVRNTLNLMNSRIDAMNNRLNYVLDNLLDNVLMVNPFTGLKESVVNVINYLSSLHMVDGITANEYDLLELTATYYDGKELTATQYDINATNLLP